MVLNHRARSQEQKQERRQEILAVAAKLMQTKDFSAINVAEVAKAAKMAKGTVFLYFKTKEELFLAIAAQEFEKWFDAMDTFFREMARQKKPVEQEAILAQLQQILANHQLLAKIIAILHIVLEHNIGYAKAVEFKQGLVTRVARTGPLIEAVMTFLQPGQGVQLVLWMYALVIGFVHMANPAPVILKVYQNNPKIKKFQVDFNEQYFSALRAILAGWQTQNQLARKPSKKSEVSYVR